MPEKLAKSDLYQAYSSDNSWGDIDILDLDLDNDYISNVEACKFFYKHDGLASNVINKLVEIGINGIVFYKNDLKDNEYRIFQALADEFKSFAEKMAFEYLLSGLVVPEIIFGTVLAKDLKKYGIKKRETLTLPVEMYVRDPSTIIIKKTPVSSKPMYFVKIDDETTYFIKNNGKFSDGRQDKILFEQLKSQYPEFVKAVREGKEEFPVAYQDLVISRNTVSGDIYPIPYLLPALEPLRHKRNLRRMDYALASRVIAGILHIKLGNDQYPLLAGEEEEQYNAIKSQLGFAGYKNKTNRIFQLYTNHTVDINWIVPDATPLLNGEKYSDINRDIIFALGFPRVLITGEAERTGTTDPIYATIAPVRTMEHFRSKILKVLQFVADKISEYNNLSDSPTVNFKPIQLAEFGAFVSALFELYKSGNISRETLTDFLGVNWKDEADKLETEKKVIEQKGLNEFAPMPFSPKPNQPKADNNQVVEDK